MPGNVNLTKGLLRNFPKPCILSLITVLMSLIRPCNASVVCNLQSNT